MSKWQANLALSLINFILPAFSTLFMKILPYNILYTLLYILVYTMLILDLNIVLYTIGYI